jgi:hypothetical protein
MDIAGSNVSGHFCCTEMHMSDAILLHRACHVRVSAMFRGLQSLADDRETMHMHVQVAELGVPYAMAHMRGDPTTMVQPEYTAYGDVATEVGLELQAQAELALAAGIEPWRIILDPGKPIVHHFFLWELQLICRVFHRS